MNDSKNKIENKIELQNTPVQCNEIRLAAPVKWPKVTQIPTFTGQFI